MQKKLKCFIACSFENKEMDSFIKKVFSILKKKEIIAIKADNINHNGKVDLKLIELINACDFCIADLTFARPSVYYEGGFVEGLGKQVIYTSRKDHFKPQADDTQENRKIHFDLGTKNIIKWGATENKFETKLSSRISLVTKPLIKLRQIDLKRRTLEDKFLSKSETEKLESLNGLLDIVMKTNDYTTDSKNGKLYTGGFKKDGNKFKVLAFVNRPKITIKSILNFRNNFIIFSSFCSIEFKEMSRLVIVFNSFNRIQQQAIQESLNARLTSKEKVFLVKDDSIAKTVKFIFIDGIKSEAEYLSRISKHDLK